ncbi:peptidase [Pantoea sp. SIMBA_079]|uniref:peptidase n=1 Tax=Pantoea sp. SIMBA_079 TaxID=3085817 RepID=UPI00399502B3
MRSDTACPEAGIIKGSVLAVDRALTPRHGQIIVAEYEGELVLHRLLLKPVPALQSLEMPGAVVLLDENQPLPVWGVVAYALNDIAGQGFTGPAGE